MMIAPKPLLLFLLLIVSAPTAWAQIDAVEPDSLLDKFYINWPIDKERKQYEIGDTVVAVHSAQSKIWDRIYHSQKAKPVYVVRAIVTDVKSLSRYDVEVIAGIKLKIYSIEKRDKNSVVFLEQTYAYGKYLLKVNNEHWRDYYGWQNISGLYKIQKSTDNYKIGDSITHHFSMYNSVFSTLMGGQNSRDYTITAIVRDIDTSSAQRLLLEFNEIALNYYHRHVINPFKSHYVNEKPRNVVYNNKVVSVGETVWTKPYKWVLPWQYLMMADSEGISSFYGL